MPDPLAPPLEEFQNDLGRIEKLLALIDEFRAFGSVTVDATEYADAFTTSALTLRTSVRAQGNEFPILSGTLLLFVAGRFEHFVRMAFEALCEAFAAKCNKFEQLPEKMRSSLVQWSAEVLSKPSKYGFDEIRTQAVVHNLSGNLNGVSGVGAINANCLSITEQNMHPGVLSELYKRIGIQSLWPELSKQARLKMYFELERDADVERSAKAALENLMTERNAVAHPNSSPTFPDVERVRQHVAYLRVLAEVLTEVCRVQLVVFRGGG